MSIWCSWEDIGYDPDGEPTEHPQRGEIRSYATGWSNHYPTDDVEQPASVDLAHIAPWCVPGRAEDYSDGEVGPWLRLGVNSVRHSYTEGGKSTGQPQGASVILDEAAARALAADLLEWADRPKAMPSSTTNQRSHA